MIKLKTEKLDLLLDNDIIIKNLHGSTRVKEKIQDIFKNNEKFVLNLTVGEFKRSVLKDLVIFFNDLVEFINKRSISDFSSQLGVLTDFLLGYNKNYGVNAKGRFINYIIKIFENICNHLKNTLDSPLEITLDFIKNQIIDYKEIYFYDLKIIGDAINCPHAELEPARDKDKFERLNFSCKECEKNKVKSILDMFQKDIDTILTSLISNHLIDTLKYIMELDNLEDLDGRKYVCLNLADLLLILNCPNKYTIFTSNHSHFNEICVLLNKSIIYLQ